MNLKRLFTLPLAVIFLHGWVAVSRAKILPAGQTLGDPSSAEAGTIPDNTDSGDGVQGARQLEPSKLITRLEKGKPTKVVLYGTSLTAGDKWGDLLRKWLAADYPKLSTVINSGGSGRNSIWAVANLKAKVLDHNPDVVFMEFSVNDSGADLKTGKQKMTVAESKANLNLMIDSILKKNPEAEIILQTMNCVWDSPKGSGISAKIRPKLANYYEGYREVAAARGLLLIDNHLNWLALQKERPAAFKRYVKDGVHPLTEGYREVVMPVLKSKLTGKKPEQ